MPQTQAAMCAANIDGHAMHSKVRRVDTKIAIDDPRERKRERERKVSKGPYLSDGREHADATYKGAAQMLREVQGACQRWDLNREHSRT